MQGFPRVMSEQFDLITAGSASPPGSAAPSLPPAGIDLFESDLK